MRGFSVISVVLLSQKAGKEKRMAIRSLMLLAFCLFLSPATSFGYAFQQNGSIHSLQSNRADTFSYTPYDEHGTPLSDYTIYVSQMIDGKPELAKVHIRFPSGSEKEMQAALVSLLLSDTPTTVTLSGPNKGQSALFVAVSPKDVEAFESQRHISTKMLVLDPSTDLIVTDGIFDGTTGSALVEYLKSEIAKDADAFFQLVTRQATYALGANDDPSMLAPTNGASFVSSSGITLKPLLLGDDNPRMLGEGSIFQVEEVSFDAANAPADSEVGVGIN